MAGGGAARRPARPDGTVDCSGGRTAGAIIAVCRRGDWIQLGLHLRPLRRHRQSLFQAAASRLLAMPALATGPAATGCGRCAWQRPGCGRQGPCACGCRPRRRRRPGSGGGCSRWVQCLGTAAAGIWPWGAGRDEAADVGRNPVAATASGLDPDQAGRAAPLAVGVARRPAAAHPDAPVALPNRVRTVAGYPAKPSARSRAKVSSRRSWSPLWRARPRARIRRPAPGSGARSPAGSPWHRG